MASASIDFVLQRLGGFSGATAGAGVPDGQLIERYVGRREEAAFTALVERHGAMVLGVCRRLLREPHDAEDAFQATFLVLARKAASIRKGESVGSWLHGVARHAARKLQVGAMRRARREQRRAVPAVAEAADSLTWREIRAVLDEELGRLPAPLRAPLILCYLESQTQDEAARRLGWSKTTVRRRLERGRLLLQGRLTRRGLTLSAGLVASFLGEQAASAGWQGLIANTTGAALAFAMGHSHGTASLARPSVLAKGLLRSMSLAKCKLAALAVLTLGLLAGAGLCAYQTATTNSPETSNAELPTASARDRSSAPPIGAPVAAVDQLGDALPADAIARLGSIRLHHGASPRALAFAPDGLLLASGGIDGTIHLWETATGKERLRIENDRFPGLGLAAIFGLAYSPDGKTLAVARINQPPCLYEIATGKEIRQFGTERSRAIWVVFAPDGKSLVYGGGSEYVQVEVQTGKVLHRFDRHLGLVRRVAFTPDGKTIAFADERAVHLSDLAANQSRDLPQGDDPLISFDALAFSPDGKALALASHTGKMIRLLDVGREKVLRNIPLTGKRDEVGPIVFTPDGKTLISGHEDGMVRFWDVKSGTKTHQFQAHPGTVIALDLTRDGKALATSSNSHVDGDHMVRLWDVATGKPLVQVTGPQQGIAHIVFSRDSRRVATTSWDGSTYLWEAGTGKLLQRWDLGGPAAFSNDGKTLICGSWHDGIVRCLDVATGKESRQFPAHKGGIRCLGLSSDGKLLVTAGDEKRLRLWDLATGRQLQDFGGVQKTYIFPLALAPDGKMLATIQNQLVRLWDTTTGKLLLEYTEAGFVGSLAFSADAKILATTCAGPEPMILLRETATGKEVRRLAGCGDPIDTVAFSPDGRTVIWGGQHRREVYLWEVATGQLRRKFAGHQGHLSCVAFSPDGRLMASGGSDASVLIWDVTGQRQRQEQAPTGALDLDKLWTDLGDNDAAAAYRAICTLRASPRQALRLLEGHLKPVPAANAKRVAECLRNLDSEQFAVRNQAAEELERMDEAIETALRDALEANPSVEVRQRIQKLLERLDEGFLQRSRALEVLEQLGTPEARRQLRALARGAARATLTRAAQAALDRGND